VDGIKYELKTL